MMTSMARMGLRWWITASLLVWTACTGTDVEPKGSGDDGAGGGGQQASGGGGGQQASGGGGGQQPSGGSGGSNAFALAKTNKVDLLFVIDNSASMADKQQVLGMAVRDLVERLTNPFCLDGHSGAPLPRSMQPSSGSDPCPGGARREFPPTDDLHIGVISSSLGGHGSDSCSPGATVAYNPNQEDMAHLLSRGAGGEVPTYQGKGYLNWDPNQTDVPPGESDPVAIASHFGDIVTGVGQDGCGFESTLESWYRFLVDPAPYAKMVPAPCYDGDAANQCRAPAGVDQTVLQQRADFLRPDSAVAIVMLTDENDCSVKDDGQSYLALQAFDGSSPFHLARGTAACATDPGSPDCKSCWMVDLAQHPECVAGWADPERDDPLNLRCYRQKERFGIDFLQPVERYIAALTQPWLEGGQVNPLFCSDIGADGTTCNRAMRDPSLVVAAGIVGVPWQDVARDPNDLSKGYLPADQIRWDWILGDPDNHVAPGDPLMIESVDPRTGTNPATGVALTEPGQLPAHPINGGEWDIASRADLQYACTFALPQPIDCTASQGDCAGAPQSPVCRDPSTHQYGETQFAAKAYPSIRQLQVLKGMGPGAVVASICPSNLSDATRADFGYRAAMAALGDRLRGNLEQ